MTVTTSQRLNQETLDQQIPAGSHYTWVGAPLEQAAEKTLTPEGITDPELQTAVDAAAAAFVDYQGNRLSLLQQARDAYQANRAYLQVPAPTNPQVVAQVRALTQQNNALIRLAAQDYTGYELMSLNGSSHAVALWAGVAAFFGSLLTISVVDVLNPDRFVQYLSAFVVAAITAGAVYSKERLSDAKRLEQSKTKLHRKQ